MRTSIALNVRSALALASLALASSRTVLAAFPGDNGRISFDREDVEVFSILPDGTGETNLSANPADDDAAAWSPDGTRIVFSSDRAGDANIWVMDAGGQNPVQVTSGPNDDHPAWSPDGTRIVFQREEDGDDDIWVVNVDGGGEMNLTNDPSETDQAPAWSPDGTRIAFCSDGDVRVMNADGTGATSLTPDGSNECNPNWSPDGTRIAFDSDADGDLEIVVTNADGSGRTQLTFNSEDDQKPAWSPDGTKLVFEAARGGDDQIHVIDAGGGNEVAITNASNPDDDREPDWQPLPLATTTTVPGPGTTTTTTTLPAGTPVAGRRLLLRDQTGKPAKRALKLLAEDPAIGVGAENDGPGDPVVHGGFLKVVSSSGDGFNTTYDLPAERWRYKGKKGRNKGYGLKGAGPVRTVVVKPGKTLKVVARGDALGHSLGADPRPVHVALGLGSARYCFTFGGNPKFKSGKSYVATKAQTPGACAALVPACGDRRLEPGESCPTLEGAVDGPAIAATSNFDGEPGVPAGEIELEGAEALLARTRVEIEFAPDATVAQVNAVLGQLGGDIVMMLANVPLLLVRIPDPGSLAGLDAAVAGANTDPKVRVSKGYLGEEDLLPGNFEPPGSADLTKIDHHLAVHAPAAWNALAAIESAPLLIIADFFGDGPPALVGEANVVVPEPSDFASGNPQPGGHGYHVLGIATGRFDATPACTSAGNAAALRACTTGMVPRTALLRAVDSRAGLTLFGFQMRIVLRALVVGNVVVNTSVNHCGTGMCGNLAKAGEEARQWALMVRGAGLENGMLHLTAAGNIKTATPGVTDALTNSAFTAAALHPAIPDFAGTGTIPNLANTLVVENVVNGPAPDFTPLCLRFSSKRGGDLSGIGTTVWSLTGPVTGAADKDGTSMSSPQVAGLAHYLWTIAPDMSVAQLRGLLRLTTRPVVVGSAANPPCDPASTAPAPIIDAYAAVLALDEAATPTPASAPVRHALVDLDDDDDLDEDDLIAWRTGLIDAATNALKEPAAPEFQRLDLNGDGYTGGASRRVPFDLDRVGSTQFGTSQFDQVAQEVEGVSVPFDETGLTDLDILCYYAYSDFYDGDEVLRRQTLGLKRCSRITLTVDFPSTIEPGLSETLRVSVGRDGPGGSEPVPNVHIQLSPAGGTVIPESGTTDAQGEFTAQAELAPDSSSIEIIVQALTAPGGEVLAEEVVRAFGPCTDAPTALSLDFGNGEPDPTVDGPTLQNGLDYRITVSGTYTVNSTEQWQNGVCKGAPAAGVGGPTGIDAEFFFAVPVGSALCDPDFVCCPNHTEKFQISLSGGFAHLEPVSPALSPGHVYEYLVQGQGAPVRFRLQESNNRGDDYGILDITVACAADTTTTTTTTTSTTTSSTTTTASSSTVTTVSTTSSTIATTSTTSTSSTTTTTLIGLPVVPYRRYAASGPDGPVVMLEDEFGAETVDLGAVTLDLPPVVIDGVPPFDQFAHQTCYAHPGGVLDTCIDIQDAFGFSPVRLGAPAGVCVPELSASIPVDAFKCYSATGAPLERQVTLQDEFQSQTVTVGAPELLCTPVEVDGDPLVIPLRYLVCYATSPPGAAGGQIEVDSPLHVDPIQVDVGAATGLCVPAVRQIVASCQLCGNGALDGTEECDDAGLVDGDGCSAVCRFERDCTCDGLPFAPPQGCATLGDCAGPCSACAAGGGACGCQ